MEKAIDRVIEALQPLTEKLGAGAEVVWESAMKQQLIEGWVFLVVAIVVGLITLAIMGFGFLEAFDGPDPVDGILVCAFALLIGGGITLGFSYEAASHLFNPEWQAVQSLAEQLK